MCRLAHMARAKIRGRGWPSPSHTARYLWVVRTQHHGCYVKPPEPLAQAASNPRQARSEEGQQSSDLLCSLRHTLMNSPTTSYSPLWRWISLLNKTRTTPGRVLKSRAVHLGQPKIKRGLCLALAGALELLAAAEWNILNCRPKFRIGISESWN